MNVLLKWRNLPKAVGTFVRGRNLSKPVAREEHPVEKGRTLFFFSFCWKSGVVFRKLLSFALWVGCGTRSVILSLHICLHLKNFYFIFLPNSEKSLPLMRLCGDVGHAVMEEKRWIFPGTLLGTISASFHLPLLSELGHLSHLRVGSIQGWKGWGVLPRCGWLQSACSSHCAQPELGSHNLGSRVSSLTKNHSIWPWVFHFNVRRVLFGEKISFLCN